MLASVDRFPTVVIGDAGYPKPTPLRTQQAVEVLEVPAPHGYPHPLSEAEQRLAGALANCGWATGYECNQECTRDSLMPTIRVDVVWPAERCVVEIDGPDHRGALKYAADRHRDNALMLQGFRVLRFTNEQVMDDMSSVLDVIEAMLTKLRLREGNSL